MAQAVAGFQQLGNLPAPIRKVLLKQLAKAIPDGAAGDILADLQEAMQEEP
jgi:hypothetical protein